MLSEAWLILPTPYICKIQREEAEVLDSRGVCSFLSLNRKWWRARPLVAEYPEPFGLPSMLQVVKVRQLHV